MSKHSILIKPERSTTSAFCTKLTALAPEIFAAAGTLSDACKRLKKDCSSKDRLRSSWGDYDQRQFERIDEYDSARFGVEFEESDGIHYHSLTILDNESWERIGE